MNRTCSDSSWVVVGYIWKTSMSPLSLGDHLPKPLFSCNIKVLDKIFTEREKTRMSSVSHLLGQVPLATVAHYPLPSTFKNKSPRNN